MTTDARTTEAVLEHHLEAMKSVADQGTGALAQIMEDYADDVVMFSARGVLEGKAALEGYMGQMLPMLQQLVSHMNYQSREVRGDVAFVAWSAGDAVPMGVETFVVRDGKIVAQTFGMYAPSMGR